MNLNNTHMNILVCLVVIASTGLLHAYVSDSVIGGLMLNETRELESRVPLLGAIPLLGWLFSYRSTETTTSEVFFVITPIIKTRAASIEPYADIFNPFDEE